MVVNRLNKKNTFFFLLLCGRHWGCLLHIDGFELYEFFECVFDDFLLMVTFSFFLLDFFGVGSIVLAA